MMRFFLWSWRQESNLFVLTNNRCIFCFHDFSTTLLSK
nr:MAG TPA: hypothetical protein [Caudoviricetes sp.]